MLDALEGLPELLGPDDLALARREHARLDEVLRSPDAFAAAFPHAGIQPIHGDAPTHNVLLTPEGPLVSDLEHAGLGPVEWDLAMVGREFVHDYDAATVLRGGRPADRELLAFCESARWLQLVCCLGLAPEAPPSLIEALVPLVGSWRSQTPAVEGPRPVEHLGVVGALPGVLGRVLGEAAVLVEVGVEPVEERQAPAGVVGAGDPSCRRPRRAPAWCGRTPASRAPAGAARPRRPRRTSRARRRTRS